MGAPALAPSQTLWTPSRPRLRIVGQNEMPGILEPATRADKPTPYFMRVPANVFHEGQWEIYRDDSRFKVIAAGRRWGKTTLGTWLCVEEAMRGGNVWWVAPSYHLTNPGWEMMLYFAGMIQHAVGGVEVNRAERRVRFPSGGQVQVRSAHAPGRLRGVGLDFLVVDEAAYMESDRWTQELRPALADKQGGALFISSPKGIDNWFYELYTKAATRNGWARFTAPSESNPLLTADELEEMSGDLSGWEYRQEMLAEFVEHEQGGLFTADMFERQLFVIRSDGQRKWYYFASGLDPIAVDQTTRVAAMDPAYSEKQMADYTAIAFADIPYERRDHLLLRFMYRDRISHGKHAPTMVRLDRDWRPDYWTVEKKASTGMPTIESATEAGLTVVAATVPGDKVARAQKLLQLCQQQKLWLPAGSSWTADFVRECLAFPVSTHDDQVDAAAYAALEMNKASTKAGYTTTAVADTQL